jgi:hypothetical protein
MSLSGCVSTVGSGAYSEDAREGDAACERGVAGMEREAAVPCGEGGTMSGRGEGGTAVSICRTPPSIDTARCEKSPVRRPAHWH